MTSKLASTINRLVTADLLAGRVVSAEDTARAAIKRAKGKHEIDTAAALAAQALAEKLEARARDARFPAEKAQHSAATATNSKRVAHG
jgi:hypothetical protein